MEIIKIDHVEFFVGNAMLTTYFYEKTFGFKIIAYKGPETGCKEVVSYVLQQGDIKFVFTSPIQPKHPINNFLSIHGDAVRSIAFLVADSQHSWNLAIKNGAKSAKNPIVMEDNNGKHISGEVLVYGDITHKFIERKNYTGVFNPEYFSVKQKNQVDYSIGLLEIDHCTSNVENGKLEEWINYYKNVLGFSEFLSFDDTDIYTDYSALMTKVVVNQNKNIKLPLIQPIDREWKSQIQEFIEYNGGPGVQHIAVTTNNIVNTVRLLKERGIEFLKVSEEYYVEMINRIGRPDNFHAITQSDIMIDKEPEGLIYQAFSKPLVDRPTFFIEIIQREGAKAFGKGNVKEFFNALTIEQSKRGNV